MLNPYRLAYLCSVAPAEPHARAPPNAVLQDSQKAWMIGGWPSPQGSLSSLIRKWPLPSDRLVGAGTWLFVFATAPVENAAELVMILNVEPGGNVTWVARLSSGLLLAALKRLLTLASFPVPGWRRRSG